MEGEDRAIGRRIGQIVAANAGAALILSVAASASGFIEGRTVAVVWGFAYASMAFHVGMVSSRESLERRGHLRRRMRSDVPANLAAVA